jgi:bifunctional non-homologous end joining protein LigD
MQDRHTKRSQLPRKRQDDMNLRAYHSKRDFKATPEPRGQKGGGRGHRFVIQKHAATRLHYDFRLEMDGVLKSWAVTRGPSLDPADKRLAVHVEDHPLDYGTFEGTIPKGQYGAGSVIVWDRGEWEPVFDAKKGYAKGHLEFRLLGEKLTGLWHLVRMRGKPGETRENWLLIKGEDEAARATGDILKEAPLSVKTGRDLAEVTREAPARPAKVSTAKPKVQGKTAPPPDFIPPALATLAARPPQGAEWQHEIKFDGYRIQARVAEGKVRLLTRSGLDWTERFGETLVQAFQGLKVSDALIDGEVVVEDRAGASDFSALQSELSEGRSERFTYYAFDLLHLNGADLTRQPLERRKALLRPLVGGVLRFSEHFAEEGGLVLQHACRLSLEGVISKRADAPYRSGRSRDWIKSKCSARQEFVVGGYTRSGTGQAAIGSLILGVFQEGGLMPVGRVGTGFTARQAEDLFERLQKLTLRESPFARKLTAEEGRQAVFVKPKLIAEVEFRAWTADGRLRHAAFRGLREDKLANEIVREMPSDKAIDLPRRRVALTNPDRVYWPEDAVTKQALAAYYEAVWPVMGPHLVGRPLALLRCPEGIRGPQFFQKHAWKGMRREIRQVSDPKNRDNPMVAVDHLDGLIGLVQAGALEIHPWGSTLAHWEKPDRIVMDLDPGEGVEWTAVIAAAHDVKARLLAAGLAAFLKTSGGKGLHVVAPLTPKATWPCVKAFCKAMAETMAAEEPERYVATVTKAKRQGRILIDYLRNQRGATAVAAYSTRARPGAAVSAPISWEELEPKIGPDHFTLQNMPKRLAALRRDPWADFHVAAVPLAPKT